MVGKRKSISRVDAAARRRLFVEAYLANDGNATEAYIAAGYNANRNAAKVKAHHMLKRPEIAAEVAARREELQIKYELNTDRVLRELSRVCHFTPKRLVTAQGRMLGLHEIDDDTAAALASVELSEEKVGKKIVTKIVKTRALNKTTALGQAIKVLRLYDKPPPPPPEESSEGQMSETIKTLAFLLEEKASRQRVRPAAPKTVAGKRVNGKVPA